MCQRAHASRAHAILVVSSVGGDNTTASIQATVDAFRAQLGNPNNGNAAGTTGGRREINWDGGGSATTATSGSLTTFNTAVPRGLAEKLIVPEADRAA